MALMRPVYSELQLRELEKFSHAEVCFYTACRDQLPESVLVIHSSSFAQQSKDGLKVGEIDFVLAFADAGLMVVEVKGGRISRDDGTGKWWSRNRNGETVIKNPVKQAREQRYALQKIIDDHPKWKEWTGGKIIYAPTVFFPSIGPSGLATFQNAFADQVSFGGKADLPALMTWTARVNEFWNKAKNTQTLGSLGLKLIEEILYPPIDVPSDSISSIHVPIEPAAINLPVRSEPVEERVGLRQVPPEGILQVHMSRIDSEQPPTTPPPDDEFMTPPTKSWDEILEYVSPDPKRTPFSFEKRDGAIVLKREWNPQLEHPAFIWTKESKGDLSFLSDWENKLLLDLQTAGVKQRVRLVDMLIVGSKSHMRDLSKEQQQQSHSKVRTYDAGPTLDVWQCMRPRLDGHPQPHPFVAQRRYLELVWGILIALEDFHRLGFTHCDLHPGNIALPVEKTEPQSSPELGSHIELNPKWNAIRIIDLDFSAYNRRVPDIVLPHDIRRFPKEASRMSDHLRLPLAAIDGWLESSGQSHLRYDSKFWAIPENRNQLVCFTKLDWREDLHQLGYLLKEIRDKWGGAAHVVTMGNCKEANSFIATFPEELMAWGKQIDWDPSARENSIKPPAKQPHADYVKRINYILDLLRRDSSASEVPNEMVLCSEDYHECNADQEREKDPAREIPLPEHRPNVAVPEYMRGETTLVESQQKGNGDVSASAPNRATPGLGDAAESLAAYTLANKDPERAGWRRLWPWLSGSLAVMTIAGSAWLYLVSGMRTEPPSTGADRLVIDSLAAHAKWPVRLATDRREYRVGIDPIRMTLQTSQAGFFTLLQAGSGDAPDLFRVLYANSPLDTAEHVVPPDIDPLIAQGPPGESRLVALVTPARIDWQLLASGKIGPHYVVKFSADAAWIAGFLRQLSCPEKGGSTTNPPNCMVSPIGFGASSVVRIQEVAPATESAGKRRTPEHDSAVVKSAAVETPSPATQPKRKTIDIPPPSPPSAERGVPQPVLIQQPTRTGSPEPNSLNGSQGSPTKNPIGESMTVEEFERRAKITIEKMSEDRNRGAERGVYSLKP